MSHLRWQALIALLGMALVVGLLAGRGQTQGESALVSVEVPEEGGVYTEALIGAPRALNPLLAYANPVDRDLSALLFSGLIRFDAFGRPTPDLANWLISEDERTYTFILKPELTWHDGQPLTAQDVAFTVGLIQSPNFPGQGDLSALWRTVTVAVTGTQTIAFTLPEPFAPFLDYAAFGILPRHLLGNLAADQLTAQTFNLRPVGSGPFQFDRWLVAQERVTGVRLRAFAGYAGPAPKLAEVQFNFYPDSRAALEAYQRGEVLGLSRIPAEQVPAAARLPTLGLYTSVLPRYTQIILNQRLPELAFFTDKRVRQALWLGLNREIMTRDLLNGQALIAHSPILPGSWAYNPALPVIRYNPEEANRLLDQAGWTLSGSVTETVRVKASLPMRFTLTVSDNPQHQAVARYAQQTWALLGVQVEVQTVPAASLIAAVLEPRNFQAVLVEMNLEGLPDPDPYPFYHETQVESGQNYGGYVDRLTSQILEQARITTDMSVRARLYVNFQSRFVDQVPALLLYYPTYTYGVDTKVSGVRLGPLTTPADRLNTLTEWFLVTRRVTVGP